MSGVVPSPPDGERLDRARDILAREPVLVLTGAGVSADSGVPTFRGPDGLWRGFRPEELATPSAFERDPRLVWEWYAWRRDVVSACRPNAAHLALARWKRSGADVRIVTQNVDGLHVEAWRRTRSDGGGDAAARSTDVPREAALELHGSLFATRCTECGHPRPLRGPVDVTSRETLPRCSRREGWGRCEGLLRPDVVWFGEALDPDTLGRALEWADSARACFVVGTSGVVQPAAGIAARARASGARVVEVNPDETPISRMAAVALRGGAADLLPRIVPVAPTAALESGSSPDRREPERKRMAARASSRASTERPAANAVGGGTGAAPPIGLVTFDCYGTLIDWETGILDALRAAWPEAEAVEDAALLAEFHAAQNRLKLASYRSYRALLTETTRELLVARGWPDDGERAASVPASIPSWRPFPDTNPALERLAGAGIRLGILSNIDEDLLAGTLERLTPDFDLLGTAERLRSYKPARPHFDLGRGWADATPGGWVHVAQSLFHDIEPATALGVPAMWVNRKGESPTPEARPLHTTAGLEEAVDWILSRE